MQRTQGALPQATPPALCPPEALQRYLILIYPGLVGAVTMVSCSILPLGILHMENFHMFYFCLEDTLLWFSSGGNLAPFGVYEDIFSPCNLAGDATGIHIQGYG